MKPLAVRFLTNRWVCGDNVTFIDSLIDWVYTHQHHTDTVAMQHRTLHTQTIHLRASPDQKALIDRAASRLGKSRTEFVLDTMREAAERVLLDQRLFNVDETRFNAFKAMLDSPVEPDDNLRKTLTASPPWEA